MGVVSRNYGGLRGGRMEVVVGKPAGQSHWDLSHVERCRSTSRVRGDDTDITRLHHHPGVQLCGCA